MSPMAVTSKESSRHSSLQIQYATNVRADTSTLSRYGRKTYKSQSGSTLLDLLCHVSQDNIVNNRQAK